VKSPRKKKLQQHILQLKRRIKTANEKNRLQQASKENKKFLRRKNQERRSI